MSSKAYYNRKVKARYRPELRGLSHKQLDNQRGLKGITLGAANAGRTLSKAEAAVIEERLRQEGYLPPQKPEPRVRLTRAQYHEYMSSWAWKRTKWRFLESLPRKICYCCSTPRGPFDVHHRTYARLGVERLSDLCLVCRPCHEDLHAFANKHDLSFAEATKEWRKIMQKKLTEDLPWNQPAPEPEPVAVTPARRARAMRDNRKAPNKTSKKFPCAVCAKLFFSRAGAVQHLWDRHGKKPEAYV